MLPNRVLRAGSRTLSKMSQQWFLTWYLPRGCFPRATQSVKAMSSFKTPRSHGDERFIAWAFRPGLPETRPGRRRGIVKSVPSDTASNASTAPSDMLARGAVRLKASGGSWWHGLVAWSLRTGLQQGIS